MSCYRGITGPFLPSAWSNLRLLSIFGCTASCRSRLHVLPSLKWIHVPVSKVLWAGGQQVLRVESWMCCRGRLCSACGHNWSCLFYAVVELQVQLNSSCRIKNRLHIVNITGQSPSVFLTLAFWLAV